MTNQIPLCLTVRYGVMYKLITLFVFSFRSVNKNTFLLCSIYNTRSFVSHVNLVFSWVMWIRSNPYCAVPVSKDLSLCRCTPGVVRLLFFLSFPNSFLISYNRFLSFFTVTFWARLLTYTDPVIQVSILPTVYSWLYLNPYIMLSKTYGRM